MTGAFLLQSPQQGNNTELTSHLKPSSFGQPYHEPWAAKSEINILQQTKSHFAGLSWPGLADMLALAGVMFEEKGIQTTGLRIYWGPVGRILLRSVLRKLRAQVRFRCSGSWHASDGFEGCLASGSRDFPDDRSSGEIVSKTSAALFHQHGFQEPTTPGGSCPGRRS